jgi:chromosome partitioning protein
MKTITISCEKGGVGKTTTAVTLAHGLALKGKSVLLLDLDPQGQCATALNLAHEDCVYIWLVAQRPLAEVIRQARPNLTIIPGDKQTATVQLLWALQEKPLDALARILKPMAKGKLDYVIIDTSPSVGGMQERALYAADLVLIPCKADYMSADTVARTVATIQHNIERGWNGSLLGVLPSFFDARTNDGKATLEELRKLYPNQVLAPIRYRVALSECVAEGKTIWEYDGAGDSGRDYAALLYSVLAL